MNEHAMIRFCHNIGAVLSGIAMVILAVAICAANGSVLGAAAGFASLVAGYFCAVFIATNTQLPRLVLTLGFTSWVLAAVTMVAAVMSL